MMFLNLTLEEERKQREIDKYNNVREREGTHHTVLLWCNVYARRQHTCTPACTVLCVHTCSRCMDCTMYACAYLPVFLWSAHRVHTFVYSCGVHTGCLYMEEHGVCTAVSYQHSAGE